MGNYQLNWTTEMNTRIFSHHGKLTQHCNVFFYSFSLIIFCWILTKSMLIKGRRKGLFCLLWGTKVNKPLGYIHSTSLFGWQEQYRKSRCSFWGEGNSPYTASLLLAEILEICSTEGEKSAAHSALLLRKHVCMIVCMRIRNESPSLASIVIKWKRLIHQMSAFFVVFCFAFPSHRDYSLSSCGLLRKTRKIPYPRALLF